MTDECQCARFPIDLSNTCSDWDKALQLAAVAAATHPPGESSQLPGVTAARGPLEPLGLRESSGIGGDCGGQAGGADRTQIDKT